MHFSALVGALLYKFCEGEENLKMGVPQNRDPKRRMVLMFITISG